MYTLYKFHFLNGISEINQLFDDILIIWPVPVMCLMVRMGIVLGLMETIMVSTGIWWILLVGC